MADFSVRLETVLGDAGSVIVKINGPTTISNVSILLMKLLEAFDQSDNVVLDLTGVTEIDVAGLQLFCSSHRSSIFINKGFKITGQNQPVIWEAAAASGQLRTSGCAVDTKDTCIWTGKAE